MKFAVTFFLAAAMLMNASDASAQQTSVWLDASALHSRPPGTTEADASSYGLIGLRLRHAQGAAVYELGATGGHASTSAEGGWLASRAMYDLSRVNGRIDFGMRVEANALAYVLPVELGGGKQYKQANANVTAQPHLGLSLAGFRIGAEGSLTRGGWRVDVSSPVTGGGLPPLDGAPRRSAITNGSTSAVGGAVSALRVFGPASVTVRGSSYDARNQAADGKYSAVQASAGFSAGAADIVVGVTRSKNPADSVEIGGQASLGLAIGRNAYIQVAAGRSVSDPVSGASGSIAANLALSMRVGGRNSGAAAASVGSAASRIATQPMAYTVTFAFKDANAQSVAVAGDFSGWELRSLQRSSGSTWTLVTVLPPGVYHYSFVVNGTQWTLPANATGIVDDGFGKKNATLIVSAPKGQAES